jgi:hypothetical protein
MSLKGAKGWRIGGSFRFEVEVMLARVSDGLPIERANPPLARIGKGPIRHARGWEPGWLARLHALSRSWSKSLVLACCMRRAASVSLIVPAMRFRALMLSPGRRYCAGESSLSRVSSGV